MPERDNASDENAVDIGLVNTEEQKERTRSEQLDRQADEAILWDVQTVSIEYDESMLEELEVMPRTIIRRVPIDQHGRDGQPDHSRDVQFYGRTNIFMNTPMGQQQQTLQFEIDDVSCLREAVRAFEPCAKKALNEMKSEMRKAQKAQQLHMNNQQVKDPGLQQRLSSTEDAAEKIKDLRNGGPGGIIVPRGADKD